MCGKQTVKQAKATKHCATSFAIPSPDTHSEKTITTAKHPPTYTHLDACIANIAHFFTIKLFPFFMVELFHQRHNVLWFDEVDKRIPHIALVLKVDGEVEKVVRAQKQLVDCGQQHLLRILVGDVFDHQRCALVCTCHDLVEVERIQLFLLCFALCLSNRVEVTAAQAAAGPPQGPFFTAVFWSELMLLACTKALGLFFLGGGGCTRGILQGVWRQWGMGKWFGTGCAALVW